MGLAPLITWHQQLTLFPPLVGGYRERIQDLEAISVILIGTPCEGGWLYTAFFKSPVTRIGTGRGNKISKLPTCHASLESDEGHAGGACFARRVGARFEMASMRGDELG